MCSGNKLLGRVYRSMGVWIGSVLMGICRNLENNGAVFKRGFGARS